MKKLKFWSRKKRKKKPNYEPYAYYHPPAPAPTCHQYYCCPISSSPQPQLRPSAPPLPPWLDCNQPSDLAYAGTTESQYSSHEIVVETNSVISTPALPSDSGSSCSYQQYMVPNPVYGLPIVKATGREKFAGIFGCVFEFGANLIRCFGPCFRIREV